MLENRALLSVTSICPQDGQQLSGTLLVSNSDSCSANAASTAIDQTPKGTRLDATAIANVSQAAIGSGAGSDASGGGGLERSAASGVGFGTASITSSGSDAGSGIGSALGSGSGVGAGAGFGSGSGSGGGFGSGSGSGLPTVTISVDNSQIEESDGSALFTVTRSGAPNGVPLTINYTVGGSAVSGVDYQPLSGSVTIDAWSTSAFIDLSPIDDGLVDEGGSSDVWIALNSSSDYTIGTPSAADVTIIDEISEFTISGKQNATEGQSSGYFMITRLGDVTDDVTLNYSMSGTAVPGTDYSALSGSVEFVRGQSEATLYIDPLDDGLDNEGGIDSVTLTLENGTGYAVTGTSQDTIALYDPIATITVQPGANATEGESSGSFAVTRTGDLADSLTVNYSVGGTAIAGTDYSTLSGSITFAPGQSEVDISVDPLDDGLADEGGSENVSLTLNSGVGYLLGTPASATITIDDPISTVTVAAGANATEGAASGYFAVTRSGDLGDSLTVNYAVGGTAVAGTDYSALSGSVTFAPGQSEVDISVDPLDDGAVDDGGSEDVSITLAAGTGYLLGTPTSATVMIDDPLNPVASVSIAATSPNANEVGPVDGQFTITRSGDVSQPLTVSLAIAGSAIEGTDYQAIGGSITIPAGQSSIAIDVMPIDDGPADDGTTETVQASIVNGPGYVAASGASSATVNIVDPPIVMISGSANANDIGPISGQITVSRNGSTAQPLTVSYSVGGTAIAGTDYQALSGSVTIPAGQSSAIVTVTPIDDGGADDGASNETVQVTLAASTAYELGSPISGAVSIVDPVTVAIAATSPTANEAGPVNGEFTLTRTGDLSQPLPVSLSIGGSAISGVDYSSINNGVTIPAGQASVTIAIVPMDDGPSDDGGTETVQLTVQNGPNYVSASGQATATVTILDPIPQSPPSTVSVSGSGPANEHTGAGGAFTITRTGDTSQGLTVYYDWGGSAIPGTDYQPLSNYAYFAPGVSSVTIPVVPVDDGSEDDTPPNWSGLDDQVVLQLLSSASYNLGTSSATVDIDDTAPLPTAVVGVTADYPTAQESGKPAVFTFTRSDSANLWQPLEVQFTLDGDPNATMVANDPSAPDDGPYSIGPNSINFRPWQTTIQLIVVPGADESDEANEGPNDDLITVDLGESPSQYNTYNVDANHNRATVTVLEPTAPPAGDTGGNSPTTVTISADVSQAYKHIANEGPTPGSFVVTRTGDLSQPLTVYYAVGGSAQPGVDDTQPTLGSGLVTIPAGLASAAIIVSPKDDAGMPDEFGSETVQVTLATSSSYTIGSSHTATVTIYDGQYVAAGGPFSPATVDPNYSVGISSVVYPDENGWNVGYVTVSFVDPTHSVYGFPAPVTVHYAYSGAGFLPLSGTVTIPANRLSAQIFLYPEPDQAGDPSGGDAGQITLLDAGGDPSKIASTASQASFSVGDQSPPADPSLSTVVITGVKNAQDVAADGVTLENGRFTIMRVGGDQSQPLTVNYVVGGAAIANVDYQPLSGSVVIPAGEASVTVPIVPEDGDPDGSDDGVNKEVLVWLSPSPNYLLGTQVPDLRTVVDLYDAVHASILIYDGPSRADNQVSVSAPIKTAYQDTGAPAEFVMTRTGDSSQQLIVEVNFGSTSSDYRIESDDMAYTGQVIFPAGQSTAHFYVIPTDNESNDHINQNGDDDGTVTPVRMSIIPDARYSIGTDSATVNLVDLSTVTLSSSAPGQFTVSRTGHLPALPLLVNFTEGGSASGSGATPDYGLLHDWVIIPAGANSVTFSLLPSTLTPNTPAGSVQLSLQATAYYLLGAQSTATSPLTTAAYQPLESAAGVTVYATASADEGNDFGLTGPVNGQFTLFRASSDSGANDLTINVQLGGTAVRGTDYTVSGISDSSTVTIPAHQRSVTVAIQPLDDLLGDDGGFEIVQLAIEPDTNQDPAYQIGPQSAATFKLYDPVTTTVSISGTTITRSGGDLSQPLSVFYTEGGTAVSEDGYAAFGQATIPAGQTSVAIYPTPIVDNDPGDIGTDNLQIALSASSTYVIGAANATTTFNDSGAQAGDIGPQDPGTPVISITADTADAYESSQQPIIPGQFVISDGGYPGVVDVWLGAATSVVVEGEDFLPLSRWIEIPAFQSVTVYVTPIDDGAADDGIDGTVTLSILQGSQYSYSVLGSGSATVTIHDIQDPMAPQVGMSTATGSANIQPAGAASRFGSARASTPSTNTGQPSPSPNSAADMLQLRSTVDAVMAEAAVMSNRWWDDLHSDEHVNWSLPGLENAKLKWRNGTT